MEKKLKIEKIVHNGYGLSRYGNKTYFVPFTIENEEVAVKTVEDKKNYAYAIPEKIITCSKHRIEPRCPYFRICGGCDFQHIEYSHQIIIKKNIISEFLQKNNIVPSEPLIFYSSVNPFHYRVNTKFRICNNKHGYLKKHSREIISIDDCPLLDENIMIFIRSIKNYPPVDSLTIKADNNNNISSNINNKRLQFTIDDLNVFYDFRTFFQANKFLIKQWLEVIEGFISDFNMNRIIELYCGTGIISLYLTKKFSIGKITGIDQDNTAINFARLNREKNKLFKIKFISGKVEKAIDQFSAANVIIIDPPRNGVPTNVLKKIIAIKPEAVIYLSCEISTFIRDAKSIIDSGYTLKKISALDMFPQTYHFETIGLFVL